MLVQEVHLGPGGDVQARFDGIAVAQWNADTGVGTDQAAFADLDDDVAAAGQGTHGRAAATEVRPFADEDTGRHTTFDHARAFGAGVKVDETFVHDGGAFANVGAQAYPCSVGDAHAGRDHVVGHLRELVHREPFQQLATQARFELQLGELGQVHGADVGPGHVWQQGEDTGQAHAVRLDQAVGQQVQLEVGLGRGGQCGVFSQQGGHQRLVAFCQTREQGGLCGIDASDGVGQLRGLGVAEGDGLVATLIAKDWCDGRDQLGARVDQGLCVEHFQPGALAVLGADTKGQAEQGIGHVVTSC